MSESWAQPLPHRRMWTISAMKPAWYEVGIILRRHFVCDDHTLGKSSRPSVVRPAGALLVVAVPVAVVVAGAAAVALVAAAI